MWQFYPASSISSVVPCTLREIPKNIYILLICSSSFFPGHWTENQRCVLIFSNILQPLLPPITLDWLIDWKERGMEGERQSEQQRKWEYAQCVLSWQGFEVNWTQSTVDRTHPLTSLCAKALNERERRTGERERTCYVVWLARWGREGLMFWGIVARKAH